MEIRFAILLMSELCICLLVTGLTWFEAQNQCRAFNKTLTLNRTESYQYYWTGFYKRTSHWMKIIGCYNESQLQPMIVHETDLQSSSPGFCQEICLQENLLLFAVQAIRCVCLSSNFSYLQNQVDPMKCNYSCDNSALLSKECGGEWTFNVLMTDLSTYGIPSDCLALQCGSDPRVRAFSCQYFLSSICAFTNLSYIHMNYNWREGMNHCKRLGTYLIGNINISDITLACVNLNTNVPRWIGVIRDQYVRADTGKIIAESTNRFFSSCEICNARKDKPHCVYEMCNTSRTSYVYCSESTLIATTYLVEVKDTTLTTMKSTKDIATPVTLKEEDTTLTIMKSTTESESPVVKIVVPVVVVLLLSICAVVVGIYYIRRKNLLEKNPNTDQNYSDLQLRLDSNSENQYEHLRNVVYENSSMENSG